MGFSNLISPSYYPPRSARLIIMALLTKRSSLPHIYKYNQTVDAKQTHTCDRHRTHTYAGITMRISGSIEKIQLIFSLRPLLLLSMQRNAIQCSVLSLQQNWLVPLLKSQRRRLDNDRPGFIYLHKHTSSSTYIAVHTVQE